MAASGGGFTSLSTAAGLGTHALPARARFPGRPCVTRSKLRSEKRTRRGRLVSADGELADGGPRPVNIGLALSEDPSLLRLLGLTEKHSRQKDAGFDSSNSEGEEDFTGFGTTKAGQQKSTVVVLQPSLRQAKAPRASEKPSGNKPLVGKIIPKTPKSSLIGKIVPRIPKEGQDVKESPVKDKETPQVSVKVQGKQEAPDAKIKNANKQTSGEQSRIKSADAVGKAGGAAGLTKHQEGVVSSLRSEKNGKQANRSNEGEVFEELDQSLTKGSLNIKGGFLMRHPRRSSEGVALTFASLHKRRWRRRTAQVTGVTPKAEVEAGPRSGQEAVMQLECKTVESSVKKVHKKRKVLLGYKRKPQTSIPGNSSPKIKKVRSRRVFYAYVPEPLPSVGGDHLQIQGQSAAPAGEEARSSLEQIDQSSNNSSTAVTSGRSSRVIKTPKRFLDEEIIPFPKGSLSTWLKSQQKDEFDGNSHPLDSDSTPVFDGTSGVSKTPGRSSPGASHLEIYKNLKKLTLKLAEKKKGQANVQEDYPHDGDRVTSPARKRRRPKIMMEELDSPGVVRKVAVVVEAEGESLKQIPSEDTGKEAEAASVREDSSEMLETAGPSHRIGLSGANKRMLHLLKKAKVQLIKIDQQKQLKLSQLSSKESQVPVSGKRRRRRRRVGLSSKEIPAQEQPLRGPRIKHVCRAAAVALGQPRAMVPDDIPRLSALPLHEREGITFSPTAEDVADDDDDDDDDDDIPEQGETQWAVSQESIPRRRRGRGHKFRRRKIMSGHGIRSRRCRVCTGCLVEEDCSKCINCLDKPKYGGPNTKRQCCIFKKCERIEKRKFDRAFKPLKIWARQYSGSTSGNESALGTREPDEGLAPTALGIKKHSLRKTKPRSYSKLLRSESEGEGEETTANKPDASSQDVAPQHGGLLLHDRRPFPKSASSRPRAHKSPADCASVNTLTGTTNGFPRRGLLQSKHKIRVDFKEDCAIQNVWLMGGLSVLSSVPTTPQPVCMLCASKGRHEMIFCQICCEPFHSFCLSSEERPHQESKENWCCRRCKFCNVCGRRNKSSKPVLQCRRCQTSYHPSCLGPTYPKPLNCYMPWVCMTCIRCKSCGVTPGKTWDMAWNHEQDLCPDCTALHKKGHFCTICLKCYEDSSQPSEMIQCLKCSHWIHHSCEGLSEELFGLLPNQTEKADFTCAPCRQKHTDKRSLKEELQGKLKAGLEEVLDVLLTSSSTRHLLVCKECLEMNVIPADQEQQQICDLKALEKKFRGDGYTSIKSFHLDVVSVMRKWIKEEERLPEDESLAAQSQAHYIQVMKQVFSCFPAFHLKKWNSFSEEFPSGMLPEAVLPPSKEHSYAQWVERTYQPKDPQADRVSSSLDVMQESSAQLNTSLCSKESIKTEDTRQCVLCQQYGDASPNEAGRLLYLGQNEWAHINCCLWSAEVNEQAGALLQVHSAVSRGRHLRCDHCGQSGATVGCYLSSCLSNFHFMCARVNKCVFLQDRKVYCYAHRELTSAKVVSGKGFEVPRRVYVDFDGINLKKKFLTGLEPESINMTIGSLQIQKLGVLSELSTVGRMLYPVGYQCSRLYWSTVDPRRHCKYTCKVTEVSTPLPGEEQDLKWDKEENHTIVHSPNHLRDSDMEYSDCFSSSSSPVKSTTPSPNSKAYDTAGPRSPGYSQARRPAGGSSRPLPSPGSVHYKSHHILTLRDLEDTRRPRRLSSRRRCSSSPTESNPSVPANLHSVRSRCSQFSPHPRSSNSPPLSPQNSTSPIFNSPPRSNSSPSAGLSPRRGAITHSPRGGQNFKITTPVSAEVPQDFLASSEAEDAAVATTNGISLAPDNLEEEVAHLMSQELPYTVFDTDVAVASMLNTKLEFEEALLAENLALNSAKAEVEGEDNQERGSDDEDSRHYGKLSRTVVSNAEGSSDETIQLLAASSISQLDGADGGSESDESEALEDEIKVHSIPDTPTKRLSVTLTRLEPLYASSQSNAEQQVTEVDSQETLSAPDFLDSRCVGNDLSLVEEEVSVTTPTFPKDVFRNSAADHFVSSVSDSVDILSSSSDDDKDEDNLSSDSSEVFKDDETDPDFHPELESKKSPTVVKKNTPESIPKQVLQRESCQFQPNVNSLTHRLGHVPSAPAMFCSVQRPVTSPIVINGLNTLPGQAGPTQGRRIAIRLDTSKPGGQPQKEVIQNQAEEANSPAPPAPARQVLLVNRQGQILLKDPLTNTFQALSSNSPAYNRISQIAKILHNRNSVSSVPRVIIKSPSSPSNPNATPMSNCATLEKKIIVKMLPVKSSLLSASPAPVGVQTVPKQSVSNTQRNPAQAIIDRAMASHRDASRPKPIILGSNRQRKLGHQGPPQVPHMNNSDESSVGHSRSSSVFSRVRVRRMPPVSERHSKKKTKIELLKDLSSEPEEIQEARTSGVRMKAPTVSDVLDLNHESKSNPVRIMAPPLPASSRRPPSLPQSRFDLETKTHTWVSSRHGDLSAWGPYTGCSSEEEAPALKHRKKTRMNQPHLRFEITSDDGFSVMANSIEVAWRAVIDSVLEARAEFHLKQLPLGVMSGPRMLGVIHDAVIFLLEQLEGAANCRQHRFRFHCCDDVEEELPLNPSGCARAEVYTRKATFDMFNFLASQHRALPNLVGQFDEDDDEFPLKGSRRATSSELPMAMRFRHLEKISKEAVGVYRSPIHGRGLFCKRNIEAGEMVIEYAGTVIRSVLTDKREKYYDGKGIGCYMFRIDDFDVVDATMQGNAARFINHSCEPNCYSRVINVDGRKHIVIFALRKIYRGEELTYDYKFPIEDDENKLRCNCGARRCRRYLN
ncbi:histone-lysine N-methyltransferase 2B isoform X3 [Nothobranchius furzeri]|uniref:[histone H3]-lysine(4) N-methyltransferase n=2 Tax=Nothobranchius furzeri TaxID=105023 RepID=A0A9D2Y0F3_NOTFU|nr:transcript variant X2 [Nothobranchius furzeri]